MSLSLGTGRPAQLAHCLTEQETGDLEPDSETAELDVSVVLPCLDEEQSVASCVREALEAISRAGWTGEVIVVDNGSTDRSAELAVAAGARVVREDTRGYGAAILRGIRSARGSVIVMADADCTYPLDQLAKVAGPVLDGDVELVLAGRLDQATRESMPLLHRFVGTPVLTWLVRAGTGAVEITDSQSGYRAFGRGLVDQLELRATGMEFASEMLIRAAQRRVSIKEVALGYRPRVGKSKLAPWTDGMRHLRLIVGLSPHLLLWGPGLIGVALGWLIYIATLADPGGATVGSLTWQPIFFGTILEVIGLAAAISGAFLARHSPATTAATRESFSWVSDRQWLRRARRGGYALICAGLALDVLLFDLWVTNARLNVLEKLHLASMAQGLLLDGVLMVVAISVYQMLLSADYSPSGR
jgi:hypothetical protein